MNRYLYEPDVRKAMLSVAPQLGYLLDDIKGYGVCKECARQSGNRKDHSTKCPIEEHYALPSDGFCHLWEAVKK